MATLKDVANKVGVSITTVSRVLNDRGAISQKTKNKVFKAMKELNYFPNEMARSLSNKNSHLIGLIVPYIGHPFFGTLTDAIEEACYRQGYKLLLCTSNGHPGREKELFSMLRANNVAGVLVCSRIDDAKTYFDTDLPIVSIERTIDNIPSVSCDNYKGGVFAAQELMESSCKHPVLFGNRTKEHLPAYLRYQGFFEECAKAGLHYEEYYIEPEDLFGKELPENIKNLFEKYPETDGIFATSDVLAARVINIVSDDTRYPQNLKVVGFDGIDISEYCNISTVMQPMRDMGELAVDVLTKRINGVLVPERSILPVTFVRRKSSGPQKN